MWKKRQLVEAAYEELGLAAYVFDISPEEMQSGIRKMDAMMADWEGAGVRAGYNLPSNPQDSDPDDLSGLPDQSVSAVFSALAIRLAPSFGKAVSIETKKVAAMGYDRLLWAAAQPQNQQLPNTLARGAGNKPWRVENRPFLNTPDESPLRITQGGDLNVLPE